MIFTIIGFIATALILVGLGAMLHNTICSKPRIASLNNMIDIVQKNEEERENHRAKIKVPADVALLEQSIDKTLVNIDAILNQAHYTPKISYINDVDISDSAAPIVPKYEHTNEAGKWIYQRVKKEHVWLIFGDLVNWHFFDVKEVWHSWDWVTVYCFNAPGDVMEEFATFSPAAPIAGIGTLVVDMNVLEPYNKLLKEKI